MIEYERKKDVKWGIPRSEGLTFPMTARPRPPPGAHSSLATRSSLFARIARQTVVMAWPCGLVSVWAS